MSLLQTYQAELLADLDEGGGIGPNVACELRLATVSSLRVVKETAKSISRSMAALVVTERHLWLNLSNIKKKEKNVLMDAPISSSGLFGNAVSICIPESRPPSYSFLWGCWVGAAPIFPKPAPHTVPHSIFKKLPSRRKHEVLQHFLVNRCSDVVFKKHNRPTPADDIAPKSSQTVET